MKKINILLSGWTLTSPNFNFFKTFLIDNQFLNPIAIVFPKKLVENIEYIQVIEPADALNLISANTIILQTSMNSAVIEELNIFYKKNLLCTHEVEDFILNLVKADPNNKIKLPFNHINSSDVIKLIESKIEKKIINNFLDFDSIQLANRIFSIFKSCNWGKFYSFSDLNTVDSEFIKLLIELYKRNYVFNKIYITDHPKFFLENLMKLRALNLNWNFIIYAPKKILDLLGEDLEFYKQVFGSSLQSINICKVDNFLDNKTLILGYDSHQIALLLTLSKYPSFLIRANKSIIVLNNFPIKTLLERKIILKQPNPNPNDLLICGLCL